MRGSPAVPASCKVLPLLKPCGLRVRLRACGICKDYFRAQLLLDRPGTGAFHIVGADQVDPVAQDDPGDGGNNHEIIKIMFKSIFKDLVSYDPYTRFLAGTNSIVYDLFQEGLLCYLLYF